MYVLVGRYYYLQDMHQKLTEPGKAALQGRETLVCVLRGSHSTRLRPKLQGRDALILSSRSDATCVHPHVPRHGTAAEAAEAAELPGLTMPERRRNGRSMQYIGKPKCRAANVRVRGYEVFRFAYCRRSQRRCSTLDPSWAVPRPPRAIRRRPTSRPTSRAPATAPMTLDRVGCHSLAGVVD